jgi:small subunit ribosomal protein S6
MKKYELMVILNPVIDPTDTKKIDGIVQKILGNEAKYIKTKNIWGKKPLAYEIHHFKEGIYILYTLEAPKIDIMHIGKQAKMMTDIIRYSLISI